MPIVWKCVDPSDYSSLCTYRYPKLWYSFHKTIKPLIGYIFAFGTRKDADTFALDFHCDVLPAKAIIVDANPTKMLSHHLVCYDDKIKQFWSKYPTVDDNLAILEPPKGTVYCSSLRLLTSAERLERITK